MYFLFPSFTLLAQVTVEAPTEVNANETFYVTFKVEDKVTEHTPPNWGEITCLRGPSMQSSQSVKIINGSMTREVLTSYRYECQISNPGTYTIFEAHFKTKKATLQSEPHTITVLPAQAGGSTSSQGGESSQATKSVTDKDLFVKIHLNKNSVYEGEPILATLKIYTRLDLAGFENVHYPDFKGFWVKDYNPSNRISFQSESVNGILYNAGVLRQYLLFPQKAGEITIAPYEVQLSYYNHQAARSIFDSFFGSSSLEIATVKSAAQKVHVKSLPSNAPASFHGAVGKFTVEATLDAKDSVMVNEAITYTINIKGEGNMQLLQCPEIQFPSILEAFPPNTEENFSMTHATHKGTVSYKYVLIPRAPGEVKIPALEYTYFDPKKQKYQTSTTSEFAFIITNDTLSSGSSVVAVPNTEKADIQYLGKDIRHVHNTSPTFRAIGHRPMGSVLWWVIIIVLLLMAVCIMLYLMHMRALQADHSKARFVRANNVAKKRLKRAKKLLDANDIQFYKEVLDALWGYLSDKLSILPANLSLASVEEVLTQRKVSAPLIEGTLQVIQACEYAQFAPVSDKQHQQQELYQQVYQTINQLNAELKA